MFVIGMAVAWLLMSYGIAYLFGYFWLRDMAWYRRWKGGTWYLVTPRPFPYITHWQQREPIFIEHVGAVERY